MIPMKHADGSQCVKGLQWHPGVQVWIDTNWVPLSLELSSGLREGGGGGGLSEDNLLPCVDANVSY